MDDSHQCHPIKLFGMTIFFPYQNPYGAQKAIMANSCRAFSQQKNALLESPTGTGKSLALLAAALAFQESTKQTTTFQEETFNPNNSFDDPNCTDVRPPKIFYTSRTHQQLKQIITEFKRLPYHPKMSVLSSRSNLCIYKPVSMHANVDYHCRAERRNCQYAKKGKIVPPELEAEKFDIEDLKKYCDENELCPFMIAREMAKTADIVFAPYNYIIDQQIRDQMGIAIRQSIIIFDEAHNIEDICRETAKFTLKLSEIEIMKKEIQTAIDAPSDNSEWLTMIKPHLSKVKEILIRISEWIEQKRKDKTPPRPVDDVTTTLSGWLLSCKSWKDTEISLQLLIRPDSATKSRLPDNLVIPLSKLYGTLLLLFQNNTTNCQDFNITCKLGKDKGNDEMMILCMLPSIVFRPIANQAHSIVLASGTMSPLDSFELELGVKFDVKLSANHIIDPKQVCAFAITSSLDKSLTFTSSYKKMETNRDKTFLHLGLLLEQLLKVIPDGVLLFVQSHKLLKMLIEQWKSTNLLKTLNSIKPIFYEDKHLKIHDQILEYKNTIREGRGGLFVGVCRGQLSEGIDFSDSQARSVIVFGVPNPNWNSLEVTLKIQYNNCHSSPYSKNQLMKGFDWYESQAKRSLFQAIGRCIRHKDDYGSIILIDDRYPAMISSFPQWVVKSYEKLPSTEAILNRLVVFYSKMREQNPVSAGTSLNLDYQVSLKCIDEKCNEPVCDLYRLKKSERLIEKTDFLNLVQSDQPMKCLIVNDNEIKMDYTKQGEIIWCPNDINAYSPVLCKCGKILGVRVVSTCYEDQCYCKSLWLIPSNLIIEQGFHRLSLMKAMQIDDEQQDQKNIKVENT